MYFILATVGDHECEEYSNADRTQFYFHDILEFVEKSKKIFIVISDIDFIP